ncbi:MAG: class I SAM-dependent methyltransferase [Candidatus Nomurabacteria bacterium]|jgi:ubiquinone/menaquinone biosynthesis C-methylase UbiE|nr:class I SAM-dependent methyltransferase [Candidatus Nomurabacteria bacterium]
MKHDMVSGVENPGQRVFYEQQWSDINLDDTPNQSGWRSIRPASDFLDFVKKLEQRHISGRALDLGCGNGRHAIVFAKNDFETYGLDFSENAIKLAENNASKNHIDTINFSVGDALNLEYADDFFNVINDDGCLHHIDPTDWQKYVENIFRVTKPDGTLRVKVFSKNSGNMSEASSNNRWQFSASSGYTYFFDETEIRNIFAKHFHITELKEISHDVDGRKKFYSVVMDKS